MEQSSYPSPHIYPRVRLTALWIWSDAGQAILHSIWITQYFALSSALNGIAMRRRPVEYGGGYPATGRPAPDPRLMLATCPPAKSIASASPLQSHGEAGEAEPVAHRRGSPRFDAQWSGHHHFWSRGVAVC